MQIHPFRGQLRRVAFGGALGLALLMALAPSTGARPKNLAASDPPGGQPPSPRRGGTLRFIQEEVTTLDPKAVSDVYSAVVTLQIHRGLLIYNTNLTPVPDLARSWTISRDGLVYALELKQGVRFHNGREVTADDVVYSFHRIFRPGGNPGLAGQFLAVISGSSEYHEGRAPVISGIKTLSGYSLEIRLNHPDAAFLWALAMTQASVVPREVVEKLGDEEFGRRPVGCGPFKLVSNVPGSIKLAAFDGYHRQRAWLDSLVFLSPPNYSTNMGTDLLLVGDVDLAQVPGFQRAEVSKAVGIRLVSRRELTLSFIGMNTRIPPFNNPGVRRAMAMAVDRQAIIAANPSGQIPATGILPPGIMCYSPEVRVYPFDLELARQTLAAAGYPGGRGLPEIPYYTSRTTGKARIVDSLTVLNWQRAGIPVKRVPSTWGTLQSKLESFDLPLFSLAWIADIPDPDSFVGSLFESRSPNNFFQFASADVDSLLEAGRRTVDLKARQAIYSRIERIILNDACIIPLYTSTTAYGFRNKVHGLELTPLGISSVDLGHVWKEEEGHGPVRVP